MNSRTKAGTGGLSKLPTPSSKRPAASSISSLCSDKDGFAVDWKRSRQALNQETSVGMHRNRLRRSKSVTSLQMETNNFRNENLNKFKKPPQPLAPSNRGNMVKAPSMVNLNEKTAAISKITVTAPTTKSGKRPAWDLKGKVEDVEIQLKSMRNDHTHLHSTIDSLQEQVQMLRESELKEKQVAQVKSKDCNELSKQLETLKSELENKEFKMSQLQVLNSNMTNQISSLNIQLKCKDEQIQSQQMTICQLEAETSMTKQYLGDAKNQISLGLSKIQSLESVIELLKEEMADLKNSLKSREDELQDAETIRRQLHNEVQELKGNIRVYCRVRPISKDETDNSIVVFPQSNSQQLLINPSVNNKLKKAEFSYDRVFDQNATQGQVFSEISQLVQSSLDGYNVCIFAYGQTGSGKTYTMEGNPENVGMIGRAVEQIFKSVVCLNSKGWKYDLKATYLEVYNEVIRDLLAKGKDSLPHEIKIGDGKKDVYVTNLNVMEIKSEYEIEKILKLAQKHRAVAATMCNDHSSRSHSVFQLQLNGNNSITGEVCQGSLNLVDLAGSERLKDSQSEGDRLKETQKINKSLLDLGNVIMALAKKSDHIPYRNSKLTLLLKNCLGGNSKTLMFVNISPGEEQLSETISSLRFATKVNNCNIGTAQKKV